MKIEASEVENELIEQAAWVPTEGDISQMGIDNSFDLYVREAMQEPLLSEETERELGKKINGGKEARERLEKGNVNGDGEALAKAIVVGSEARERLARANTRWVLSRASVYWCPGRSLPDLTQGGNIGLMEAVDKYDYMSENRFSTYATHWIDREIRAELRNSDRLIHLPKGTEIYAKVIKQVLDEFKLEGRPVVYEDIAQVVAERTAYVKDSRVVTADMIRDFVTTEYVTSLNKAMGEDEDTDLWEMVKDKSVSEVWDEVSKANLREIIDELLGYLDPKQERVIRMRFGLNSSGEGMSYKKIGDAFGLSREWARLEQKYGLVRLRAWTRGEDLEAFLEE